MWTDRTQATDWAVSPSSGNCSSWGEMKAPKQPTLLTAKGLWRQNYGISSAVAVQGVKSSSTTTFKQQKLCWNVGWNHAGWWFDSPGVDRNKSNTCLSLPNSQQQWKRHQLTDNGSVTVCQVWKHSLLYAKANTQWCGFTLSEGKHTTTWNNKQKRIFF